jgi:transcriptional regulator with XRE-family HTH domain
MTMRRTIQKDGPHPVDVHVGKRVRVQRTLLGINQTKLGDALGLAFQQVQKYENGRNRISASRLYEIGNFLDVPVPFFFEEMDVELKNPPQTIDSVSDTAPDPMIKRETLELARAYYRIKDPAVRKHMGAIIRSLAE